jgi:hypothetical protein
MRRAHKPYNRNMPFNLLRKNPPKKHFRLLPGPAPSAAGNSKSSKTKRGKYLLSVSLTSLLAVFAVVGITFATVTISQNIQIGSGTPNVTLDGDDLYVTGTAEVDGASRFDGTATFNATSTFNSDLVAKTGGTATFVVAASDASDRVKNQADYVADGTADDVEIQAAIDALPDDGGKVVLSEGTFVIAAQIDLDTANAGLSGQGWGTVIQYANASNLAAAINIAADGVTIKNLKIAGNSANQTTGSRRGIHVEGSAFGSHTTIEHVWIDDLVGIGIMFNASVPGIEDVKILNCTLTVNNASAIRIGNNVNGAQVTGNFIDGGTDNPTGLMAGIIVYAVAAVDSKNTVIKDNIIRRTSDNGIEVRRGNADLTKMLGQTIIEGNIITDGTGGRGIDIGDAERVIIKGNYISNWAGTGQGIHIRNRGIKDPDRITIEGNILHNNQATNSGGIIVNAGTNVRVIGNDVSYHSREGIKIDVAAPGAIVSNNTVYNNSQETANTYAGINIQAPDVTAVGNYIYDNQATRTQKNGYRVGGDRATIIGGSVIGHTDDGVEIRDADDVLIQGLSCGNNGQRGASDFDSGIMIRANTANVNRGQIIGSRCWDDQGSPTQNNGIVLRAEAGFTVDGIRIFDNELSQVTIPFTTTGAGTVQNTVIRNNAGHITESSGTSTVPSGSTSTTTTHGLSVTPTANDCSVTPTNNLGNASSSIFWADTFGATSFKINVGTDPGASSATFAWSCQVL